MPGPLPANARGGSDMPAPKPGAARASSKPAREPERLVFASTAAACSACATCAPRWPAAALEADPTETVGQLEDEARRIMKEIGS